MVRVSTYYPSHIWRPGASPEPDPDTIFFEEGFDDTSFAARSWYDNPSLTTTSLESYSEGDSLEIHFAETAQTPTFGGGARKLFTESESVYLGYRVKYSANWVGSGVGYHPHEFQIVTNEDTAFVGPAESHLTCYVETNYDTALRPVLAMADRSNIDLANIGVDLVGVTEARAACGCNGDADPYTTGCFAVGGGNYWNEKVFKQGASEITRDTWHHVEAYFQLNTVVGGIGQTDGIIRYWLDGELIVEMTDVLFRTGAHPNMMFNQLLIAPYIGDGSPVAQTMWVDDLVLANYRPDSSEPVVAAYTNEPMSFAHVADSPYGWDDVAGLSAGGGWEAFVRSGSLLNASDAEAPLGAPNVTEWVFPLGMTTGTEPYVAGYGFGGGVTEWFSGWYQKLDADFVRHPFQLKWTICGTDGEGAAWWWTDLSGSGEPPALNLRFQGTGWWFNGVQNTAGALQFQVQNVQAETVLYPMGEWVKIEMHARHSDGGAAGDGFVRLWQDGVLICDIQNIGFPGTQLSNIHHTGTYGGTGFDVPQEQSFFVGHQIVKVPTPYNEPSGFSVINDTHWTEVASPWGLAPANEGATTIEDGTLLQWLYPAGGTGGATFGSRVLAEGATEHGPAQYHREEGISVSANFQGHPSGVNKLRFWISPDDSTDGYLMFQGSGSNPLYPAINTQGWAEFSTTPLLLWDGATNLANPTAQQAEFVRGETHTVETLVDKGTPGGADGEIRLWLNGVLVLHFTGLSLTPVGETATFGGLHYAPVWGGIDGTVVSDMTLRIDRTYVSAGGA